MRFNKIFIFLFSAVFYLDASANCNPRSDLAQICFDVTDGFDDTNEELMQALCDEAAKKVLALTGGAHHCKLNDGSGESVYCVIRSSNINSSSSCRSTYRHQSKEKCTEVLPGFSRSYCEWWDK